MTNDELVKKAQGRFDDKLEEYKIGCIAVLINKKKKMEEMIKEIDKETEEVEKVTRIPTREGCDRIDFN